MKFVSTQPFNALGYIAQKKGQEFTIKDEILSKQLVNMGYIKKVEPKKVKAAKEK